MLKVRLNQAHNIIEDVSEVELFAPLWLRHTGFGTIFVKKLSHDCVPVARNAFVIGTRG